MKVHHAHVLLMIGAISASPAVATAKPVAPKTVEKITCSKFIGLDDQLKPQAISYAMGYNKAKHPDAGIIDVTGVERAVPIIVSSCKVKPSETMMQRVRALWNRL